MNSRIRFPIQLLKRAVMTVTVLMLVVASVGYAQQSSDKPSLGRETFVPSDQLDVIFERTPNGVMLPRAEFQELLDKAHAAQTVNGEAPTDIVVRSAAYSIRQEGNHALVTLSLEVEQFQDGWQLLKIPSKNLNLEEATISGSPATIGRDQEDTNNLVLLHRRPGRFVLDLKFSTLPGRIGSDRVIAFGIHQAVGTTLQVECPAGQYVEFNDLELNRPADVEQETEYTIPAGSLADIQLKWTTQAQQAESETLVFVSSDVQARLSQDGLRWASDSRVTVFGGEINELNLRVPNSLEVTAVESTGLESWNLEDDPEAAGFTRVSLRYRQPFSKDRLIKLTAVTSATSQIPSLQLIDVTAHSGRIHVSHEDQLRLNADVGEGLRQLSGSEAGTSSVTESVFDFWLQEYELSVSVRPRDRELFGEVNTVLNFADTMVHLTASLTVETLNAPLFELPVSLPEGWQPLVIAAADGTALKWRVGSEPNTIIVEPPIPVAAGQLLSVQIQMSRAIDDPSTIQQLSLPAVLASDVTIVGGTYRISSASDLKVTPVRIEGLVPIHDASEAMVFSTQGTTFSGDLTIERTVPRISATSEIRFHADSRQLTTRATLTVDVMSGTIRELDLRIPDWAGDEVRFAVLSIGQVPGNQDELVPNAVAIIEQSIGEAVDGQRVVHLKFDRRMAGSVVLNTLFQTQRNVEDPIPAAMIQVVGAVRQHGLVVAEASPEQHLSIVTEDGAFAGLTATDAGLVDKAPEHSDRRVALVFRHVQPDYSLTLNEQRYTTQTVPSAVCQQVRNISLLNESDSIQRVCEVDLLCVGVQTLRFALPNPETSYLWSTVLNGEAIEVRRDGEDYLVAIPANSDQVSHSLKLLFEDAQDSSDMLGKTEQHSVAFAIDTEPGQRQLIDILDQTWEVQYPKTSALLDYDGGFHAVSDVSSSGWLQSFGSTLSWPTVDQAKDRLIPLGIFFAILFVITVVVIRRRWITLGGLCLCGFLFLLILPATQVAREAASRGYDVAATEAPDNAVYSMDYEATWEDDMAVIGDGYAGGMEAADMDSPMEATPHTVTPLKKELAAEAELSIAGQPTAPKAQFEGGSEPLPPAGAGGGLGGGGAAFGGFAGAQSNLAAEPGNRPLAPVETESLARLAPAMVPSDGTPSSGTRRLMSRRGKARLSVRVDLQTPEDYNSTSFRSVGGTDAARRLQLVVQSQNQISVLRWLTALVVVVVCWRWRSWCWSSRIALFLCLLLLTAAAVPLIPNQWQSVADGVGLGAFFGLVLWCVAIVINCLRCVRDKVQSGLSGHDVASKSATALLLIGLTICSSRSVTAQESNSTPEADGPNVVLPYSPDGPALMANQVFLPQEDFLKLYRAAYPDELQVEKPPQSSLVTAAFYQSTNLSQIADKNWSQGFRVRYVIRSYSSSTQNVVLPLGAVAIRSAQLNGSSAVLVPNRVAPEPQQPSVPNQQAEAAQQQTKRASAPPKSEAYSVRIPTPGLHLLDVEFEVPATVEQSVGRMTVPFYPVASGSLKFELPSDDLVVQINGRSDIHRQDGNSIVVPVSSASATRIQWQAKTSQSATDTIFHSAVTSALVIDDFGLTNQSSIQINCRQGELAELNVQIPEGYSVQEVNGEGIAGWSLVEGDSQPFIRILFRSPVDQSASLQFKLFSRKTFSAKREVLDVPVPVVVGATRDTGSLCVLSGREMQIRSDALSGVSQVNPTEVPVPPGIDETLRRTLAWRYTRHPAAASIRVSREVDSLVINSFNAVQLEEQRQLWTSYIAAEIKGGPRRRIDLKVPRSFLAMEVEATDLADWYLSELDDDAAEFRNLSIQFASARAGHVDIVVQGQADQSSDRLQPIIVAPQVTGATSANTRLSIWLDAASETAGFTADGWTPIDSARVDQRIKALQADAPDISFVNQQVQLQPVQLNLRQAAAMLLAESVSVTNVTDTSLDLTLGLNWQISRAATRQVSFELPEALADVFDFQVEGLRQLEQSEPQDGKVQFTIHLQQPVSERLFALGVGTLPLPSDNRLQPLPPLFVTDDSASGAATITDQTHFWVIVNQSESLLEPVNVDDEGEDVDPDQIKTYIPEEFLKQSVAVRKLTDVQQNGEWQIRVPEKQEIAPAVIALAEHVTILADDFTWRSRHTLQVRNASRQFLPVFVPDESRFLYCLVEGRPTRVVSRVIDDDAEDLSRVLYLIPVPQSDAIAAPFEVEFALTGMINQSHLKAGRLKAVDLSVPAPEFPEYRDHPDYGVTVSRNTWSVYSPESLHVSLLDDPRQTNVIPAKESDFRSSVALSAYDNLKSFVATSRDKGIRTSRESVRVLSELQEQRQILADNIGNGVLLDAEQAEALGEIDEFIQQQQIAPNEWGVQFDTTVQNGFLLEEEARRNRFNAGNNMDFYSNNAAGFVLDGLQEADSSDLKGGTTLNFRFVLPEQQTLEKAKSMPSKGDESETRTRQRGESRKESTVDNQESFSKSRSQLLRRYNDSGGDRFSGNQGLGLEPKQRGGEVAREQMQMMDQGRASNGAVFFGRALQNDNSDSFFDMDSQVILLDDGVQAEFAQGQQPVASAGVLSLQFQLPTDGVRHDFIRTGGNPDLTLSVRSSDSVNKGIGIVWAFVCLVAVLFLLKAVRSQDSGRLVRTALLFLTAAGLAGTLTTSGDLKTLCLLICVVASMTWCVVLCVSRLRTPFSA